MYKKLISGLALLCFSINNIEAQPDSSKRIFHDDSAAPKQKYLPEITMVGRNSKSDYQQMPEIVGTNIYAGKKNALIVLDNVQGNVVTNTMRQVLAKVPGIHIWESDGSGIQIGIAARGLSPNRSWEFNIRQNGYDIAADPFGYPEAYYNPQLQAVQRIEVVRGQGSLQYGPQFGGMVNYILRNGSDITKPFQFETQQTVGSFGLFNSYNAVGGKTAKVHYYSFFDHRNGDGWRANSRFYTNAGYGTVTYYFTPKLSLSAELMYSQIRSQQPGGITDAQLQDQAKQSTRSRNWFDIKWMTPALILNYNINENTRWNTKLFATIGDRNSVGYLQGITVKDSINPATMQYNNRVLNIDQYRNYALESRIITDYHLGKMKNTVAGGIRLYTGNTYRRADGKGTTGSDYDMTVIGEYARDVNFRSNNIAAFVENIFRINEKIIVIPGLRYEWLEGSASGRNGYDTSGQPIILQNITRSRSFILAGVGAEYHVTQATEFYGNISQAYRPIQFANLQAPPTTDIVDPDLKDAKGYNIDFGYRGKIKNYLQFDVSGYYLQYNNRVGTVTISTNPVRRLITNVGNSTSKGFEGYVEFNPVRAFTKSTKTDLIVFGSYSYTDARYTKDAEKATTKLEGKWVENSPRNIFRGGVTAGYKGFLFTTQLSYVDESFSDANNTVIPGANAQNGLIPSYTILDFSATYKFNKALNIKTGLNNVFDKRYFTRRAGGYPGPGAMPGEARNFFVSVAMKL
ncbi:MAG: TonB-dependent receptor [Sphingobacteriales bacterium]|nr:TonB-dependent receptor [Sphingobacteriales bacterium]